jgi:hypothetical protein
MPLKLISWQIVAKVGNRVFLVSYDLRNAKSAFVTLQISVGIKNARWRTISNGNC